MQVHFPLLLVPSTTTTMSVHRRSVTLLPLVPLLLSAAAWGVADGAPAGAEVRRFPGFAGTLPSRHYAGYIPLGDGGGGKNMYYYYFAASERDPSRDPVMLFVTGGPGCSGLISLVSILGPFKVEKNADYLTSGTKINLNPYSWTKISSVIFVDAPALTGYSYIEPNQEGIEPASGWTNSVSDVSFTDNEKSAMNVTRSYYKRSETFETDDLETVSDLYEFVTKWFSQFPEFISNPFYLAGLSYSSVYVTALAHQIVSGIESGSSPAINFKGYTLGGAAVDIAIENNAKVPFAYHMGLISDELNMDLVTNCNGQYWNNEDSDCLHNLKIFNEQISGVNAEHILCLPCHVELGFQIQSYEESSHEAYRRLEKNHKDGIYCHDYNERVRQLFDLQSSREDLHALPAEITGEWVRCSSYRKYTRNLLSLIPYHLSLTKKGYRAFIYSGDHDMLIPPAANLEWIKSLNYSTIESRRPWFVGDQIAGYMIRYEHNLLFATFRGAGHTVPEYMPREALAAHERWLGGSDSL